MSHVPANLELQSVRRFIAAGLLCLLPSLLNALPEDANQPILTESASTELYLDTGVTIYRGSPEKPARITQGTMQIEGTEIRIELADDESLRRVTATGSPARFQQQPAANQQIVHVSGLTLAFDNVAQMVTVDEQAEFTQGGTKINSRHIDYNLQTRTANAEEDVQMVVPPAPNNQAPTP